MVKNLKMIQCPYCRGWFFGATPFRQHLMACFDRAGKPKERVDDRTV